MCSEVLQSAPRVFVCVEIYRLIAITGLAEEGMRFVRCGAEQQKALAIIIIGDWQIIFVP